MLPLVVSLAACGLPLSNLSAKRSTFSNSASPLNSCKIIFNYQPSGRNWMPDSSTRIRKSRGAVIFCRRLKRKRNSRICPCGFCKFHLNSPQMDEKSVLAVLEAASEEELLAAANLRVRTFYEFNQGYRAEEHRRYMLKLEFEALKDRTAGERLGFNRVACVIATIPIDEVVNCMDDLYSSCKVMQDGEKHVVVGTLDINQSIKLPDEISGTRPKGIEADFARAYLTNVCVAKELHRKGIGTALIMQALKIAQKWGKEALWIKAFLEEMGLHLQHPILLHVDNQGAMFITTNPVAHSRTKHIEVSLTSMFMWLWGMMQQKVCMKRVVLYMKVMSLPGKQDF